MPVPPFRVHPVIDAVVSDRAVLAVCTAGAVLLALLAWPGFLNGDSVGQLAEARSGHLTDWHQPIMSVLWRPLLSLAPSGPEPMLVFQLACYWLGIALIAREARIAAGPLTGVLVLLAAFNPFALFYLGQVIKDVAITTSFLLALGLILQQRRTPAAWRGFVIALLLAYGALVRANAVFALGPLIALWLTPRLMRPLPLIGVSAAVSLAALVATGPINNRLLGAEPTYRHSALQLYDLAGIEHWGGARANFVLRPACYTPYFWDKLATAPCGELQARAARDPHFRQQLSERWLTNILRSPLAYARHRIAQFNSATFFIVPFAHQCVEAPDLHDCDAPRSAQLRSDLVKKAFPFWPTLWLALAIALLLVPGGVLELERRALLWSGLFYGFAYLLIGMASDFRYFLWTVVAVSVAMAMIARQLGARHVTLIGSVLLLFVIAGYAARLAAA